MVKKVLLYIFLLLFLTFSSELLLSISQFQFKVDLLHPDKKRELGKHKLKRLVQSPNSYFLDVKCTGCQKVITVFSHATSAVVCGNCGSVVCSSTGGKARLTTGVRYRKKAN
jgi:small subunit ribosomal protein S27e